MIKKAKFFIGLFTFAFIVGLSVRHSLSNYGVKENKLHTEILAQSTSGTGTGTGTGSGTGSGSGIEDEGCYTIFATCFYPDRNERLVTYTCDDGYGGDQCINGFEVWYQYEDTGEYYQCYSDKKTIFC